ncbi:hypothetical protein MBLNU230_g5460t1 [Neophaeotheca triangularis]
MSKDVPRVLRPWLFTRHRLLHHTTSRAFSSCNSRDQSNGPQKNVTHDYEKRVKQLEASRPLENCYPRIGATRSSNAEVLAMKDFDERYGRLEAGQTVDSRLVTVAGRVSAVRTAGSKLLFLDLKTEDGTTQCICQLAHLEGPDAHQRLKTLAKIIRKGDFYTTTGHPHRTPRGELSVLATLLPELLSPSLHQIPSTLQDAETRARQPHVDMLTNSLAIQTLKVRHIVEKHLTTFLDDLNFIQVRTPILTPSASGATARPFTTLSTELPTQPLTLRIAPELWLKRLVIGGLERVYEIGPAFRNEGVDGTHNPEFTICEFYQAYADLETLMTTTETLLFSLAAKLLPLKTPSGPLSALPTTPSLLPPFTRVPFLPTLAAQIAPSTLPDLSLPRAQTLPLLSKIFTHHNLPLPANPTLPRLLDALAAHFLEPLCAKAPTFITHHPAALSPLAKTFRDEATGQLVAARAELYIGGREVANMYEEENSPFAQREKFLEQGRLRELVTGDELESSDPSRRHGEVKDDDPETGGEVDESYLRALEWGLPPTGGWGCGVDRLVMLFAGRERLADVLAFGSLRNVVGLGKEGRK